MAQSDLQLLAPSAPKQVYVPEKGNGCLGAVDHYGQMVEVVESVLEWLMVCDLESAKANRVKRLEKTEL